MPPKPTTNLLKQLRALMQNNQYVSNAIQAYIIPSNDAHNSEYLSDCDMFRAYISGFTGSAGTAIVTDQEACLWTDGRYYLQASQEMDSNWTLMKEGLPSTPSQGTWLVKNLPTGSKVGVDPNIYTYSMWMPLQSQLEAAGHELVAVPTNLIQQLWTDRPVRLTNPIHPLSIKLTGKRIGDKLDQIREQMLEKKVELLVLTALDEIAWTLNLRGSDVAYNPVFFAYLAVHKDRIVVFINPQQNSDEVKQHLQTELGTASYDIRDYSEIFGYVKQQIDGLKGYVWFSENASFALTSLVPDKSLLVEITPVPLMKAVKNPTEIAGMKNAHVKDAVALCCYFSWLERNVAGGDVTEISGAKKLEEFRSQQQDFVGPSFPTISSVGPHGAIIHYQPNESTDIPITTDTLYLCDSGAQFLDGTTDVTRTFHFGTPTAEQIECYTRVLKGQLKLATTVFPSKIKGNCLDSFAREFLWEVGLDYSHGTGHGIGAYLNVHEGPMGISWRTIADDPGLESNMFVSNEPGYYKDGEFGIRIEDIVQIVPANPPNNFNDRGYLTFDTVTLVPKQTKLIDVGMLTPKELAFLNEYHRKCRDVIGPLLEQQGHVEAKEWLWKETEPLEVPKKSEN